MTNRVPMTVAGAAKLRAELLELKTVARPDASIQSASRERQWAQIGPDGKRCVPQARQRWISSRCERQPAQKGAESGSGTGSGLA